MYVDLSNLGTNTVILDLLIGTFWVSLHQPQLYHCLKYFIHPYISTYSTHSHWKTYYTRLETQTFMALMQCSYHTPVAPSRSGCLVQSALSMLYLHNAISFIIESFGLIQIFILLLSSLYTKVSLVDYSQDGNILPITTIYMNMETHRYSQSLYQHIWYQLSTQ